MLLENPYLTDIVFKTRLNHGMRINIATQNWTFGQFKQASCRNPDMCKIDYFWIASVARQEGLTTILSFVAQSAAKMNSVSNQLTEEAESEDLSHQGKD